MPVLVATFDPAWATVGLVVDGSLWPTSAVRTNLCTNPNFETNTAGWLSAQGGAIARDTVTPISGVASLKLTNTGSTGNGAETYYTLTGTPGDVLTASLSYQTSGTITGTPRIDFSAEVGVGAELTPLPLTQTIPARFSATTTVPAGGTTYLRIFAGAAVTTDVIHVDDVLIEKSATAGTYFDGSTADTPINTYAWTGTPNASTSTKTVPAVDHVTITRQVTGQEDLPVRGVESLPVLGGYFVGSDPEAPLGSTVTYRVDGYLAAAFVQSATVAVDTTGAADGLWVKVPGDPSSTVRANLRSVSDIASPTVGGVYQIVGGGAVSQAVASWSGIESDQGSVFLSVDHPAGTERLRAALAAARVLLLQPVGSTDLDAGFYFVGNVSRSNPAGIEAFSQRWFALGVQRVGVPAGDGQGIPGWTCAAVLDTYATCAVLLAAQVTCFDLLQGV